MEATTINTADFEIGTEVTGFYGYNAKAREFGKVARMTERFIWVETEGGATRRYLRNKYQPGSARETKDSTRHFVTIRKPSHILGCNPWD